MPAVLESGPVGERLLGEVTARGGMRTHTHAENGGIAVVFYHNVDQPKNIPPRVAAWLMERKILAAPSPDQILNAPFFPAADNHWSGFPIRDESTHRLIAVSRKILHVLGVSPNESSSVLIRKVTELEERQLRVGKVPKKQIAALKQYLAELGVSFDRRDIAQSNP